MRPSQKSSLKTVTAEFINYVNSPQAANDLAAAINSAGGEAYPVQADVRDAASIKTKFDGTKQQHGGVDILVSNANMNFTQKHFMEQTWSEFSQKLNDAMYASYVCAKYAAA